MNGKKRSGFRRSLSGIIFFVLISLLLWIIPQMIIDTYAKDKIFAKANDVPSGEVIMVMGARVYPDKPSQMLAERLDAAIELYQLDKAPRILVSGAITDIYSNEPQIMKEYLLQKGIPENVILEDSQGINSYHSFLRASKYWKFKSVIVATTDYHLPRCVFLGNKLGLMTTGYASPNRFSFNMPYNFMRESLAKLKAIINIYFYVSIKS